MRKNQEGISMEKKFESMGISQVLREGLKQQQITEPTSVQMTAIPPILEGQDVLGCSETGSGKTLAYLIPIFEKIDIQLRAAQAIILTPTHELASQVYHQAVQLAENAKVPVRAVLLIGQAGIGRQIEKLKEKPQIIIGSQGRILDLIQRKKINAQTVKTIVLDEADRLLDDLNLADVKAVIKTTLRDRQLVLLSASVTEQTRQRAKEILKEGFTDISVKNELVLPESISHYYMVAQRREKFLMLRKVLAGEVSGKAIVFINNPENIRVIVDKLIHHGIPTVGIYGGAYKLERQEALADFRQNRAKVLVASDLVARGLDVEGVSHIIHLDVPEEPVFYLHRAGRTGRAGQQGKSISIVTPYETKWIRKFENTWHISIAQVEMSRGVMQLCKENPNKKESVVLTAKKSQNKQRNKNVTKK